jgi:hypothetical protein
MSLDAAKAIMEVAIKNAAEQDAVLAQFNLCAPKMSFVNTGA